jgi:hypothetical protein
LVAVQEVAGLNLPKSVIGQIARGEKTTIRRPAFTFRQGFTPSQKPFVPKSGQVWSGSFVFDGKDRELHFRALNVKRDTLRMLSWEEAWAEGYESPEAFAVSWVQRFDKGWIEARVREGIIPDPDFMVARFDHDLTIRPTWWWVIRVAPDHDVPRLLAPAARPKGSVHGYVASSSVAMPDEPEAVPTEVLDPKWARGAEGRQRKAKKSAAERAQKDREFLSFEERLKRARDAARLNNVDVSSETFLLRRTIQRGQGDEARRRRLEAVERVAYREEN